MLIAFYIYSVCSINYLRERYVFDLILGPLPNAPLRDLYFVQLSATWRPARTFFKCACCHVGWLALVIFCPPLMGWLSAQRYFKKFLIWSIVITQSQRLTDHLPYLVVPHVALACGHPWWGADDFLGVFLVSRQSIDILAWHCASTHCGIYLCVRIFGPHLSWASLLSCRGSFVSGYNFIRIRWLVTGNCEEKCMPLPTFPTK